MNSSPVDYDIMPLSPLFGESAAALMALWKAQMAWVSLVGPTVAPPLPRLPDDIPADLEDLIK